MEHLRYIEGKIAKVKRALCRVMPNLREPHESKSKLYSNIIQSVVMYGAPVWAESFIKNRKIQKPLARTQRYMATRIIAGYKTISYEVATLLARTPPWELVVNKYRRMYSKIKEAKEESTWTREREKEIKQEEEEELYRKWRGRIRGELSTYLVDN